MYNNKVYPSRLFDVNYVSTLIIMKFDHFLTPIYDFFVLAFPIGRFWFLGFLQIFFHLG